MNTRDLRIGAILYTVNGSSISGMWIASDGSVEHFAVGSTIKMIPRIDALREELRNPMAVSNGRTPQLRKFMDEWGDAFLPPATDVTASVDVAVFVPHAVLHDLPLHLVRYGADQQILGRSIGFTYASSRSLFVRCASRNGARTSSASALDLDHPAGAPGPRRTMTIRAGGTDVLADQRGRFRATCHRIREFVTGQQEAPNPLDQYPYTRNHVKGSFRATPQPDILSIMAHGYVDPDDHRMSGLLLERDFGVVLRSIPLHGGRYFSFGDLPLRRFPAQVRASRRAEVLTAAELEIDAQTSTQLVILIGCSAGWGRVLYGDEPASLAETFLHIGAPSVVAAMWDSNIDAAEQWVHHFLTGWIDLNLPKALAARHALEQMTSGVYSDRPELFGVMTLRGDWL